VRVRLVTPAARDSRSGNRTTAVRWARILRSLGHAVQVSVDYDGEPADLMVALHAWRSAGPIARFAECYPGRPLVVALTGTDLYGFLHSDPGPTLRSLAAAHRLVVLHALADRELPPDQRHKVRVVYQSARALPRAAAPAVRHFDVCVAGHLREEKDPLRAAYAVREAPAGSRLRVLHYGRAHSPEWAAAAQAEAARNPRYIWRGEQPYGRLRQAYARSRLLVLSSRMEGGANVVSEAVMAGLPVVASRIAGSVGLLGEDYPGYYPVGDTQALREVLLRAEADPAYLARLAAACEAHRARFEPQRERQAWRELLAELGPG
jgi:putative glycosyltransferase (TIGR04348 family)